MANGFGGRRVFTIRSPTAMTIYGDMGYVTVKCPCGWYVTTGSPHVPLNDFSDAVAHADTCDVARPSTDAAPEEAGGTE